MPTGFMPGIIALLALATTLASPGARAADVALIGVIGDKAAIVSVDGGDPKTIKVGQSWRGISVLSIEKDRATVEIDGKRQVLQRGFQYRASSPVPAGRQQVKLAADTRGHFIADGSINGSHIRFMVDTGASAIAIPGADAQRMGLDYRKGERVAVQTAAGQTIAYAVRLDTVRLGAIELQGVEGFVVEKGLNISLLGMSFLNRLEMKRDGPVMTLTRLY
jgi:aspartyl protease family protein